jgi:HSP20 family protein
MFSFKKKVVPTKISLSLEKTINIDESEENWLGDSLSDGRLAIDVYDASNFILVKAAIASVSLDDLDISLHNDLLTIRGKREIDKETAEAKPLIKECYWGNFSRGIVLPYEVDPKAEAYLESGLLTIKLKKIVREAKIKVKLK